MTEKPSEPSSISDTIEKIVEGCNEDCPDKDSPQGIQKCLDHGLKRLAELIHLTHPLTIYLNNREQLPWSDKLMNRG